MEVISNLPYDTQSRFGKVIVLTDEKSRSLCGRLCSLLESTGYSFRIYYLGDNSFYRRNFIEEMDSEIMHCTCLIPVFNGDFFKSGDTVLLSVFWYAIGRMNTRTEDSILPFIIGEKENVNDITAGTPLKDPHSLFREEDVIRTLREKFADRLLQNVYYNEKRAAYIASRSRIYYRQFYLRLQIPEEAFRAVDAIIDGDYGSDDITDGDELLQSNLMCNCRLLRFGDEKQLTPQMEPFRSEIVPDSCDIPSSMLGQKLYKLLSSEELAEQEGPARIHAFFEAELLIPVHKLLGSYVKPYLTVADEDYFWILPVLFAGDLLSGFSYEGLTEAEITDIGWWKDVYGKALDTVHFDETLNRMYFSFGFQSDDWEHIAFPKPEEGVGEKMDYIFPQ